MNLSKTKSILLGSAYGILWFLIYLRFLGNVGDTLGLPFVLMLLLPVVIAGALYLVDQGRPGLKVINSVLFLVFAYGIALLLAVLVVMAGFGALGSGLAGIG